MGTETGWLDDVAALLPLRKLLRVINDRAGELGAVDEIIVNSRKRLAVVGQQKGEDLKFVVSHLGQGHQEGDDVVFGLREHVLRQLLGPSAMRQIGRDLGGLTRTDLYLQLKCTCTDKEKGGLVRCEFGIGAFKCRLNVMISVVFNRSLQIYLIMREVIIHSIV